jgi:hypothetical protein
MGPGNQANGVQDGTQEAVAILRSAGCNQKAAHMLILMTRLVIGFDAYCQHSTVIGCISYAS